MQCPIVPINWEHTTCFTAMLPLSPQHNHCRDHFIVNEAEVLKIVFEKTEDFSIAILKEQVAECQRQIVWNTQCFFAEDVLLRWV